MKVALNGSKQLVYNDMQIFNGKIEEMVLRILFEKDVLSIADLIMTIKKQRKNTTKQGVYRVLRKLSGEEKIIIHQSSVSLNRLWLTQIGFLLDKRSTPHSIVDNVGNLQEGEKISIKAKGLIHLDQLWADVFLSIEKHVRDTIPLYLFNPHNWSIILRNETDKMHMEHMHKKQRWVFLVIGSKTALDRETRKMVESDESFQCFIDETMGFQNYLAVIGEYCIQVKLSQKDTQKIDWIFKNSLTITDAKEALQRMDMQTVSRLIIEKNKTKALVLKKKLAKDFYIPKKIKNVE